MRNPWALILICAAAATSAANSKKVALPGLTWDSIKRLPDWSGMWTPSRAPAGASSLGTPGGMFGQGAPLAPKYAALRDKRMILVRGEGPGGTKDIPLSNSGMCLPNGTPHNMEPVSHEYLYSPGRVTLLLENSEVRRIWTDGRGHVPDELSNPSYSGDSIGHWEGDTLVVDTINIFPEAELFIGQHVTEKTHVKERITRVGTMLASTPWWKTRSCSASRGPIPAGTSGKFAIRSTTTPVPPAIVPKKTMAACKASTSTPTSPSRRARSESREIHRRRGRIDGGAAGHAGLRPSLVRLL